MKNCFDIQHLTFHYPDEREESLADVNLSLPYGQFVLLAGPSGGGKTTLLRHLKTALTPHGRRSGSILFEGRPLATVAQEEQSRRIGFVLQSPDAQIVTDKVWHELAFGLESLGLDNQVIRARVAEMASFFGMEAWFRKEVRELSGGQKQLLNLASVMAMQPDVLLLDEPTSQLDPIAAADFLATVDRIHRELSTTVLLSEHRLEEALPYADRILIMDGGRLLVDDSPREAGRLLLEQGHPLFWAMPAAMRIRTAVEGGEGQSPLTVAEGRLWLADYMAGREGPFQLAEEPGQKGEVAPPVLGLEEVSYRYEKDLPDVLRGFSLSVQAGEFYALLGGNGTGKTTALALAAGLLPARRGRVQSQGRLALLPQDPTTLLVAKTVWLDLLEALEGRGLSAQAAADQAGAMVALCRLEDLLERHPYDLSVGEQQRLALAKVLLQEPDILLLDEPTKGLDADFKALLASILRTLLQRGVTLFMVSHDVEFCAAHAHRCGLLFDGAVVAEGTPRDFFSANSFYTTAASRMARQLLPRAVTAEDVIGALGGTIPQAAGIPEPGGRPPAAPGSSLSKPGPDKLSRGRKGLVVAALVTLLAAFIRAVDLTDLSALVTEAGATGLASGYASLYAVILVALAILAWAQRGRQRGRGTASPEAVLPATGGGPDPKRGGPLRRWVAPLTTLLLIPLTLFLGFRYLGQGNYYLLATLILLEAMLPFVILLEGRKPKARELVLIAVLCALGVAGRAAFFMLPEFKPVIALVVVAGVALGAETGFFVGAGTMLLSNMLFAQGPWTPWQMFAMGLIGFLSGLLYGGRFPRPGRVNLALYGAFVSLVLYGGLMNPAAALLWTRSLDWKILAVYYVTGLPIDVIRAAGTAFFLWFAGEPLLEKLDRIRIKHGLGR